MTDKELISKIKSLKNINPDANWLSQNRDLLLSQVSNSGARELSVWQVFAINLSSLAKAASRPAYALGAFVLILITGSIFSHQAFSSAKPNDSLYIARVISEKAKLNTMFNADERNKLAVQFATRQAQDISTVLADPSFNTEANQDAVAKLNNSFNEEIVSVKNHISYLSSKKKSENNQIDANTNVKLDLVTIADSGKDDSGVQLFEGNKINTNIKVEANPKIIAATTTPVLNATSVLNVANSVLATTTEADPSSSELNADKVLEEAKQLFEKKDYTKASDKLKEVDEIIKN